MTTTPKIIHLLSNAHLDPVWLWEWEEGAAEAVSTFRTAADLCEKDDLFIFNHNEVTLYEWVREYEPELFKRIQKLVKRGKWHIMGGWYLQPDCNMPSGESFVRQILHGKNYFKTHFGVEPTTAINFDPFGHTRGLVQILAKSGYDAYLFGRPDQNDCPLPADEFVWVGYDGSEVMAARFAGWYNSHLGQSRQKIEQWLTEYRDKKHALILWGVGNHGGGPSKKDLRDLNRLIHARRDVDVRHSTPENFFRQLRRDRDTLPRHRRDLNPWAVGCYTSQVRIKQKMRRLENEIYLVEKMAATAAHRLITYPRHELNQATHDLLVGQFHDILPGSSIQPVEDASLRMLDHGLEIAARLKARAFFALCRSQKRAPAGNIPIMVYNPHPYPVTQLVECEFQLPDYHEPDLTTNIRLYHRGKPLPCQVEKELSNLPIDWRKRLVFAARLEPGQINRFDCRLDPPQPKQPAKPFSRRGNITFKTPDLNVVVNTRTGLIDRLRIKGLDLTTGRAAEPLVMRDNADPWDMLKKGYPHVDGRFKLMNKTEGARFSGLAEGQLDSVRLIEDGPVRSVIEAVFAYGSSFICQRYKLPRRGAEIEIETRVHWNEKDRCLKLAFPLKNGFDRFLGQVAYGVGELPVNGDEAVAQKWLAVLNTRQKTALTCINEGVYGSSFSPAHGLRLTLLRSPAYSCHPWNDRITLTQDRYLPRIDQGERLFRFWLNAGPRTDRLNRLDREALAHNEKPFALSFFPPGLGRRPRPLALLSDSVVQLTALKMAENNRDYIIRLFEPTGRARRTVLSLPALGKKIKLDLKPFEIKTLRVNPNSKKITEVDLLERKLK